MPLLGSMNHVSITVSDLTKAMGFFKPFLEFLGYHIWDVIQSDEMFSLQQDPNGQRVRVIVNDGNGAVLNIWEAKPALAAHPFEVYEVGLHHIAFNTDTREQVDQVCALVKKLGAEILDGPGEFPYDPEGWYAVYFLGPDGLKFEVVHQPSTVRRYGELMRLVEQAMKH
jgi:glyoxylase I family protein